MLVARPQGRIEIGKTAGMCIALHRGQHQLRDAAAAIGREHVDFERADRIRHAPLAPVLVGPADDALPAVIGQFVPLGRAVAEREGHAEGARDHAIGALAIDAGESEIQIAVEIAITVVERGRPVVPHEFRQTGLDFGREQLRAQIGPLRQGEDG